MCDYGLLFMYRVAVSVVTIEGTECRMVELGQVADKTGGQVQPQFSHTLNTS